MQTICTVLFLPCSCARGKSISFACLSSIVSTKIAISRHLGISETRSTTNKSKSVKNLIKCASNCSVQPMAMSVTNSIFLLAIKATPIDRTHSWPCAFCSCAQQLQLAYRSVEIVRCILYTASYSVSRGDS